MTYNKQMAEEREMIHGDVVDVVDSHGTKFKVTFAEYQIIMTAIYSSGHFVRDWKHRPRPTAWCDHPLGPFGCGKLDVMGGSANTCTAVYEHLEYPETPDGAKILPECRKR